MFKWLYTSENWLARWLTERDQEYRSPKIPPKIQERINRAEYDAMMEGKCPCLEYEAIYRELTAHSVVASARQSDKL